MQKIFSVNELSLNLARKLKNFYKSSLKIHLSIEFFVMHCNYFLLLNKNNNNDILALCNYIYTKVRSAKIIYIYSTSFGSHIETGKFCKVDKQQHERVVQVKPSRCEWRGRSACAHYEWIMYEWKLHTRACGYKSWHSFAHPFTALLPFACAFIFTFF